MTHAPPRAPCRLVLAPAPARARLLALAASLAAGGCLFVGGERAPVPVEPAGVVLGGGGGPAANRTIPLELTFIRCDPQDAMLRDELWGFVDEQALAADLRGRLAANGLRVGIVGSRLPPHLAARLQTAAADESSAGPLSTDAAVSRRTMRLLPGRRGEILTKSGVRELVLLEQADGQVRGATYRDASPLFGVEVEPAGDGRVNVTVTPEIRHGPVEKSWVGEDGMFRLEAGQRRHRMEQLEFAATLPRDGMLVVGAGGDAAATAGDCLLREHDRGGSVRLLVIRPLAEPVDPLFAPAAGEASDDRADDDAPLVVR